METLLKQLELQLSSSPSSRSDLREARNIGSALLHETIPLDYLGEIYHITNMLHKAYNGAGCLQTAEQKANWSKHHVQRALVSVKKLLSWWN